MILDHQPYRISRIELPRRGTMLLGACPGRGGERGAGAERRLESDLAALAHSGATGILSLVEARELPTGPESFGRHAAARNLQWISLPIADYGVPDAAFEAGWRRLALAERLRRGEIWAIHCKAGLGRTGTIAARLLIEDGLAADAAIAQIRREHDARAIETPEQERYLAQRAARAA